MVENENEYIISGGEEGKKRLDVISEILNRYTKNILEIDGRLDGKRFLDMGCGGGSIALMVAKMVGKTGYVTAIDFDKEIVELARKDAIQHRINNVTYKTLNAYDIDYKDVFDIAYARFLLSHLKDPLTVIRNMLKALKPKGRLIIEDVDFSGHFCIPGCKAFDSYLHYYVTAAKNNGQDANIGLSLVKLFKIANVRSVEFDVIQPAYNHGKGKWVAYLTMTRIKETIIKQGLASADDIRHILEQLEEFAKNEDSIISLPRIFRVWGVKSLAGC